MAGLFFYVCAEWEFWSFGELYVTGNGDGGGRGTAAGEWRGGDKRLGKWRLEGADNGWGRRDDGNGG